MSIPLFFFSCNQDHFSEKKTCSNNFINLKILKLLTYINNVHRIIIPYFDILIFSIIIYKLKLKYQQFVKREKINI